MGKRAGIGQGDEFAVRPAHPGDIVQVIVTVAKGNPTGIGIAAHPADRIVGEALDPLSVPVNLGEEVVGVLDIRGDLGRSGGIGNNRGPVERVPSIRHIAWPVI